jgi:hypothetical protein
MQPNSTATGWADFRELVASQDVDILDQNGELAAEELLAAMDQHRSGKAPLGAAWRWMVAVADIGLSLELQLQALPCGSASLAASPVLRQDNVASIVLAKFSVQTCSFNGKECAGPIPILFSTDPEETAAELLSDSATAHEYCQELVKLRRIKALAGRGLLGKGEPCRGGDEGKAYSKGLVETGGGGPGGGRRLGIS